MPFFPQLSATGVMTQRPYEVGLHFATSVVELPGGTRQQWGWRGMGLTGFPDRALGTFELNYTAITNEEVTVLRDFFVLMRGRYGEFSYLDPNGNLVSHSEDFGDAAWTKVGASVGGLATDPFNGTRARTASGNQLLNPVLTDLPDPINHVLTASVWVKPTSGGLVAVGFSGFGVTWHTVPLNSWTRIQHTQLIGGSDVSMEINLNGSAGSIFGAQVVPTPGPGGYMRTPGNPGLHPKCRFDVDTISPRYVGPNQNSLRITILEYN